MEKRIKSYEAFIEEAVKKPTKELARYHAEMLRNFQHERLVHLIIMLFFVSLALSGFCVTAACVYFELVLTAALPIYVATLILTGLSFCYVKHYYFLENHIQKLYQYSEKIFEGLKPQRTIKNNSSLL